MLILQAFQSFLKSQKLHEAITSSSLTSTTSMTSMTSMTSTTSRTTAYPTAAKSSPPKRPASLLPALEQNFENRGEMSGKVFHQILHCSHVFAKTQLASQLRQNCARPFGIIDEKSGEPHVSSSVKSHTPQKFLVLRFLASAAVDLPTSFIIPAAEKFPAAKSDPVRP